MGYIRDNVDAFMEEGYSYEEAKVQAKMFEMGSSNIDYGFCNPRKAKQAHEDEQELRQKAIEALDDE